MCPQLAYPHGCCDRVFIEPGPIESKKSVPFIILSLISLSLSFWTSSTVSFKYPGPQWHGLLHNKCEAGMQEPTMLLS